MNKLAPRSNHESVQLILRVGGGLILLWFSILACLAPSRFGHVDDLIIPHLLSEPSSADRAIAVAYGKAEPSTIKDGTFSHLAHDSLLLTSSRQAVNDKLVGFFKGFRLSGLEGLAPMISHLYPDRLLKPSSFSTYPVGATLIQGLVLSAEQPFWFKVSFSRWCNLLAVAIGLWLLFKWLIKQSMGWWSLLILLGLLSNVELILHSIHGAVYGFAFLAGVIVLAVVTDLVKHQEDRQLHLKPWQFNLLGVAAFISYQAVYTLLILLLVGAIYSRKRLIVWVQTLGWRASISYLPGVFMLGYQLYRLSANSLSARGINWNAGPAQMFLFDAKQILFQTGFTGLVSFWPRNLGYQVNLHFASALGPFSGTAVLVAGLAVFIVIVIVGITYRSASEEIKRLILLLAVVFGTAFALVTTGKLTLSPTRHWLFYLPFFWALLIVLMRQFKLVKWMVLALVLGNVSALSLNAKDLIDAHRTAITPDLVNRLVSKHQVDMIIAHNWAYDLTLMKNEVKTPLLMVNDGASVWARFNPFWYAFKVPRTIMLISHRQERLTPAEADQLKAVVDLSGWASGKQLPPRVKMISQMQKVSATEVEALPLTHNGTNSLYITVLRIK